MFMFWVNTSMRGYEGSLMSVPFIYHSLLYTKRVSHGTQCLSAYLLFGQQTDLKSCQFFMWVLGIPLCPSPALKLYLLSPTLKSTL